MVLQHRITIAVDNGFYLLAGLTHRALVNGIRSIVVDILLAEQRVNLVAATSSVAEKIADIPEMLPP